jgi:hypothetical protein
MKPGMKTMLAGLMAVSAMTPGFAKPKNVTFEMVRSPALPAACIPKASATVTIVPGGPVETMTVSVSGLPPNTDFDFFVIQVPNEPFGMSWYQGDIETNSRGQQHQHFIGGFSEETFVVAPGVANAPVDPDADQTVFPDATTNPMTNQIQMYHLGLWFNNPSGTNATVNWRDYGRSRWQLWHPYTTLSCVKKGVASVGFAKWWRCIWASDSQKRRAWEASNSSSRDLPRHLRSSVRGALKFLARDQTLGR